MCERRASAVRLCCAVLLAAVIIVGFSNAVFGAATMESYISEIDGSRQPFGLYLPEPFDPNVPHPVVLHLHAGGQRADTSFPNTAYANARGWIMVKPDARGAYPPYLSVTENDPLRVLEEVRARFKVDENRIYSMGTCSGAGGSVSFSFSYPDVFAAIGAVDGRYELYRFHANWCSPIGAPSEVHPARLPLLEGLSPYDVAENAKHVKVYLGVDTNDTTVPPQCGYELHDRLNELGYAHSYQEFPGGHTEGYDPSAIYEFISEHVRNPDPQHVVLKANQLKYGSAYWVRMDRLEKKLEGGRFGSIVAKVTGKQKDIVEVTANGLVQFTLSLTPELVTVPAVSVVVNGESVYTGPPQQISVSASLDESGNITGWSTEDTLPRGLRKTAKVEGPIDHAYMSKFSVVIGTTSKADTARNRAEAGDFVAEWNALFLSSSPWGGAISPVTDDSITADDIATTNLILFGTADSNSLIRTINDALPIRVWRDRVVVGATEYVGSNYGLYMIFPNPLNPERYVVISRGSVEGKAVAMYEVGEAFCWPDYAVFDMNIVPRRRQADPDHPNPPYPPDMWVEAGFFDQYWRLDNDEDGMDDIFEKDIVDADPEDGIAAIGDVNPGDDFDGDGQDNCTEYTAGTNPTDAGSFFCVLSASPDPADSANFNLSWKIAPGRSYYVRWADSAEGPWHEINELDPEDVQDDGDIRTWTDKGTDPAMGGTKPGDSPARFYKLAACR